MTTFLSLPRPLGAYLRPPSLPMSLSLSECVFGSVGLTVVPSTGEVFALGVASTTCPHCCDEVYPQSVTPRSWRTETEWLFPCCENVCGGCLDVIRPDSEMFCYHCERCGSCCECLSCSYCDEKIATYYCESCNECERCVMRGRCECETDDYDEEEEDVSGGRSLSCDFPRYETEEGFVAQYGRHTDLASFSSAVIDRRIPEEPGFGYVACWVAPDGAVMACSAHYNFNRTGTGYQGAWCKGYVRITAQRGSYTAELGMLRPTDAQLDTLTTLWSAFCTPSRPMYFDAHGGFRKCANGRIDNADAVRWTLLDEKKPLPRAYWPSHEDYFMPNGRLVRPGG